MATIPKICVVMSAYNAERYLVAQVDSILAQTDVDVRLHVRDDGSSDGTVAILTAYAETDPRVSFISGPNLKPLTGFMTALQSALQFDSHYFAFSDADDYWMPEKLSSAIQMISVGDHGAPRAVCSAVMVADAELRPIKGSSSPEISRDFRNALVQCNASGATVVMNRVAADVVAKLDSSQAVMHDAWVYLVTSALGEFLYDPVPRLLYRQHGRNFDGATEGKGLVSRFEDLAKRTKIVRAYQAQAESFLAQVEDLIGSRRADIARTFILAGSGIWPTLRFAASGKYYAKRRTQIFSAMSLLVFREAKR
jgi:glycosyltransferase involved in cell wall biosynthesis